MIIFGAGVIGEATLAAARAKGEPVHFFLDDKLSGEVRGVPIIRTEDLQPSFRFPDMIEFALTSPNIEDMIRPLERLGFRRWHSCGRWLQGFDVSAMDWTGSEYSVEHIKFLIRTALHHHENYLHPERLTVQSVDLMVTERCSMKCRDCSNLMQYYEQPENADLDGMRAWIDALCAQMDEVYEFRVIGGEPFMHKQLHEVVAHLCAQPKVQKVSIFTNATILPRAEQWAAFGHPKVYFFITDYDALSRKRAELVAELTERKIAFVSERANSWTDCASLGKHNRTQAENEALWDACCAKNLATLADGRLYRCPFAANAAKLGAVPDYPQDYLQVDSATREQIGAFLRDKRMIETCDHCNGRSYGEPFITPGIQTKKPLAYIKWR